MTQQQQDPIIKLYFDLIKKSAPDAFKAFYYGDPIRIPASFLPAVIGTRRMTQTTYGTSQEDEHSMQIVLTVVTDIRKDISDETQLVPGWNRLFDIVEGRDPTTLLLKTTSLLNMIRHGYALANNVWTDVRTATKVDYGLVSNKRAPGAWSIEAALTTTCTLVQIR